MIVGSVIGRQSNNRIRHQFPPLEGFLVSQSIHQPTTACWPRSQCPPHYSLTLSNGACGVNKTRVPCCAKHNSLKNMGLGRAHQKRLRSHALTTELTLRWITRFLRLLVDVITLSFH